MLFNSINFAIFLPVVFVLYWFVTRGKLKLQNALLLVSSYFFYACWDYRFLFLLIFSTLLDYFTGIKIHEVKKHNNKKFWLWLSVIVNLGFLGVFKYYNFFSSSFAGALSLLGIKSHFWALQVILPVGISFYTFHGLSYVIDIYNERIKPERNFIDYSVFVSFFPLLVAGPIERATHLLPQILNKREFDYTKAVDGMRQILWGLFKKIVIADNCAEYANTIFNNSAHYSGSTLVIGALFFAFQIYGDFSGYSDIAIGTARLFGIDLLRNFAFPYFSRDMVEFWKRWHISLSSWLKDYLFFPITIGISNKIISSKRSSKIAFSIGIFITWLLCGLWHGANWTFILWGLLNGIYIIITSLVFNKTKSNIDIVAKGKDLPTVKEFLSMAVTFGLTVFAWIFFRANSLTHAFSFIKSLCYGLIHKTSYIETINFAHSKIGFSIPVIIFLFVIIEWFGREQQYAIAHLFEGKPKLYRRSFYYLIFFSICIFAGSNQKFVYFQF